MFQLLIRKSNNAIYKALAALVSHLCPELFIILDQEKLLMCLDQRSGSVLTVVAVVLLKVWVLTGQGQCFPSMCLSRCIISASQSL